MKSLFVRYKKAEKEGDILNLIEELTEKEILQLYQITGKEEFGLEVDRLKGKL